MPRLTLNEAALRGYTHEYTINTDDLTNTSSGATQDIEIDVPAGTVVQDLGYKLSTAFSGGVSAITLAAGISSGGTEFLTAGSVYTGGSTYVRNTGSKLSINEGGSDADATIGHTYTAAGKIYLQFNPTSDSLSALTDGEVTVQVRILDLNPSQEAGE